MAWSIENNIYPSSGGAYIPPTIARQAVAAIIRSYTSVGMQEIANYCAERWEGNQNGADFCFSPYTVFPAHPNALAERITGDTWKLSINVPVGSDYAGVWRTPFEDACLRVSSVTVIRNPVSFFNPPDAAVGTARLCNGQDLVLENLTSLIGRCIKRLNITSREPVVFIIKFDDCGNTVVEQNTYVLFDLDSQTLAENSTGSLRVRLYTGAALQSAVTVDVNASPTQGTDFTYTPTQVTFPIGSESGDYQDVTINALSDSVDESNENVVFTLANPTGGAQIGLPNTHVLTITNQWEHVFDFTQSDGGFARCTMPEQPVLRGEYVAGTGWRTTPFNDNQMDSFVIGRSIPNTVSTSLTSITLETTNGVHYAAFYNRNAWIPIGERNAQNTADKTPVSAVDTLSGLQMVLTNAFAIDFYSPDGSQRTLTRLTLRGTGVNPFV